MTRKKSVSKKTVEKKKQNKNSKKNNFFLYLKKSWDYIWKSDSFLSYILSVILAIVLIKFIIFPGLGLILKTNYPVVAIVSGSMEHKIVDNQICGKGFVDINHKNLNLDEYYNICGNYYSLNFDINKTEFESFKYKNGLNIGDMMVLYGKDPSKIEVGEVLVFIPEDYSFYKQKGPVIHRVIKKTLDENGKYHFQTKGDHNAVSIKNFEEDITEDNVIGVGVLRIPYLGYIKVAINDAIIYVRNLVR